MEVKYSGTDFLLQGQEFELNGEAWNESRFRWLKAQNKTGKIVCINKKGEKLLVPIGQLDVIGGKGY